MGTKTPSFFTLVILNADCNIILCIEDAQEGVVSCPEKIVAIFLNYFEEMFHSSYPIAQAIEASTSSVKQKVTIAMNLTLMDSFTREEVKQALT